LKSAGVFSFLSFFFFRGVGKPYVARLPEDELRQKADELRQKADELRQKADELRQKADELRQNIDNVCFIDSLSWSITLSQYGRCRFLYGFW